ncbi:MAG: DUF2256 domain-containing protein [Bacteroidota bacterium]|nr:DUF2256 domain-containing protein [Bacteroidota bacterium]
MRIRENLQNTDHYKTCPTCNRLFNKRKKWNNNWDNVIYCSKRCRNEKKK